MIRPRVGSEINVLLHPRTTGTRSDTARCTYMQRKITNMLQPQ